jgi:hypothetical protein
MVSGGGMTHFSCPVALSSLSCPLRCTHTTSFDRYIVCLAVMFPYHVSDQPVFPLCLAAIHVPGRHVRIVVSNSRSSVPH